MGERVIKKIGVARKQMQRVLSRKIQKRVFSREIEQSALPYFILGLLAVEFEFFGIEQGRGRFVAARFALLQ